MAKLRFEVAWISSVFCLLNMLHIYLYEFISEDGLSLWDEIDSNAGPRVREDVISKEQIKWLISIPEWKIGEKTLSEGKMTFDLSVRGLKVPETEFQRLISNCILHFCTWLEATKTITFLFKTDTVTVNLKKTDISVSDTPEWVVGRDLMETLNVNSVKKRPRSLCVI
nr:AlNc14C77G5146 [Albugo laibachii Nc14]|eukprot:CCA19728.1 AlNc14C77G5146 [Albugo laibachii Nc14]